MIQRLHLAFLAVLVVAVFAPLPDWAPPARVAAQTVPTRTPVVTATQPPVEPTATPEEEEEDDDDDASSAATATPVVADTATAVVSPATATPPGTVQATATPPAPLTLPNTGKAHETFWLVGVATTALLVVIGVATRRCWWQRSS